MAYRGGTGRPRGRACARFALLACALTQAACASPPAVSWRAGRYSDPALGGSLGDLALLEPGWREARSPEATLAYRHLDGSRASWLRECRAADVSPKALGRALWIALPGAAIEGSSEREVAGLPAWQLEGRAQDGPRAVRIATITRVAKRCEDSFLLVVPHAELHHRDAFEAWVSGFSDGEPRP
jgi:hypothetical protein